MTMYVAGDKGFIKLILKIYVKLYAQTMTVQKSYMFM